MKRRIELAVVAIALAIASVPRMAADDAVDWNSAAKNWWAHVQYLADDSLQGRHTGTAGFDDAAGYVEKQFRDAGLQPAGTTGYRQDVAFNVVHLNEVETRWEIERNGQSIPVQLGTDALVHAYTEDNGSVEAPAVFVGYGFAVPEKHFDEFAGIDLRGKIAVSIGGRPSSVPGPISTYYQLESERWDALRKAGAIGYVNIANPKLSLPWERTVKSQPKEVISLADPALNDLKGLKFRATINSAQADKFLEGSGHTVAELLALADAGKPLPKFDLKEDFRAHVAIEKLPGIRSTNIAALLPGSDPKLKNEYVVLSAHLDHLGVGRPIDGDNIYNGAMDNAAGTASLTEIAKTLSASSDKPKRSVLFLSWTGEEEGMLGSQYFVAHPTVPLSSIVAAINMDMYLPLFPLHYLEVQGLGESTLGNDIRAVAQRNDVEVQFDKQPPENRFIRSDQASFVRRGIPGLAFKFGWLPDSPEQKTFNEWIHTRYHAPSDDLNQQVDRVAAAQFTSIIAQLAQRVANSPEKPTWYAESFYSGLSQRVRTASR
ncbi:MAG: M20/M25/M40 family metallo-hydrolase [Acidobacteria bacterium]|nr:M20/M25/M40 family metallo-hydrolase [Acidobacteriota bacterium]